MTELEALKIVWRMARRFHQGGTLHGLEKDAKEQNLLPADQVASARALQGQATELVWQLICRVDAAEGTPDGATDLAIKVLEEHGYEVYLAKQDGKMFLRRFLDLSTAHLSLTTCQQFQQGELATSVTYDENEYGWWVWATQDDAILATFPEDLQNVIRFARRWQCAWIKLDCDAEVIEGLPVYDDAGCN